MTTPTPRILHGAIAAAAAFASPLLAQSTLTVGPGHQFATIQAAITAAASQDTIAVAAGIYLESIDFLGKDLAVVAMGPTSQGSHVIDAQGSGTVVRLGSREGPSTRLEGFTITGGQGAPGMPGGILIHHAQPTVRGCWIVGNVGGSRPGWPTNSFGDAGSGGIDINMNSYVAEPVTLEECTFLNNRGGRGSAHSGAGGSSPGRGGAGGVSILGRSAYPLLSEVTVRACRFENNVGGAGQGGTRNNGGVYHVYPARDGAGGISVLESTVSVSITDCTFRDNAGAANAAGAIDVAPPWDGWRPQYGGAMEISDCVLAGNRNGVVRIANEMTTRLRRCLLHANVGTTLDAPYDFSFLDGVAAVDCAFVGNSGGPVMRHGSFGWIDRSVIFGHDCSPSPELAFGAAWNSVLWNNTGSLTSLVVEYSCVEGGLPGTGNIASNPQFVRDPSPGPDGAWGTADDDFGDLRLQPTSPCIDAGVPRAFETGLDLGGHPLLLDGDLDGNQRIDIGAHEFGHVRLASSTPSPRQLSLALTGTPNLLAALAVGLPATRTTMLAPLGELFFDLGAPIVVLPVASLPVGLSFTLPAGQLDLMLQAVVFGGAGGNVSNPLALRIP